MDSNEELSALYSKEFELSDKTDKNLYDVVVHTYESRKKYRECPLSNHSVYLFIEDVSENYANDMENRVYFRCVCLECGRMEDFSMSRSDRNKVVDTHFDSMTSLLSFYEVREKYLELKSKRLSDEEIAINLNAYYSSSLENKGYKKVMR